MYNKESYLEMGHFKVKKIKDRVLTEIRKIAKREVWRPSDLMRFDPKYEELCDYAFGGFLVCADKADAQMVLS